jgi:hypothetical protein
VVVGATVVVDAVVVVVVVVVGFFVVRGVADSLPPQAKRVSADTTKRAVTIFLIKRACHNCKFR